MGASFPWVESLVSGVTLRKTRSLSFIVLSHLLLVLRHFVGGFLSHFVQTVQVDSYLVVIILLVEHLSPDTGYSHLDQDYCFDAIGESEGGFSCWCSYRSPVGPQNIR